MDHMQPAPGPELPRPEKLAPHLNDGDRNIQVDPEKLDLAPGERLNRANDAVAQATVLPLTAPIPQVQSTQSDDASSSIGPTNADDADVIEKEWVQKAKEIVAKTREDPHQQSVELTGFKREYMKKRYGKDIKQPDENIKRGV